MKALIATPMQSRSTGNHVTAERHRKGLESFGWDARVIEAGEDSGGVEEAAFSFQPDVLYLLHAYRTGRFWVRSPRLGGFPAVVLLTGTDIHGGIDSAVDGPVIREVLHRAHRTMTQNAVTFEDVKRSGEPWVDRLRYLPPAVVLGETPYPLRSRLGIPSGAVLFLHPAGIRPVKGNLELLHLFDGIASRREAFRIVFCGPCLDAEYGKRFLEEVQKRPWALYLGALPPAAMAATLREADVILNHSHSEGLSNALLEAVVLGRPILARDIPGNAAVVEDGINGFLYRTPDGFLQRVETLLIRPERRRALSIPHPDRFRAEEEARALDAILKEIAGT